MCASMHIRDTGFFGLLEEPEEDDCVTGVTSNAFFSASTNVALRADHFSGSNDSPAFSFFDGHFLV